METADIDGDWNSGNWLGKPEGNWTKDNVGECSGDWISPGKAEDQALPTHSPLIPANSSPAVAPHTPNASMLEEATSTTQVITENHETTRGRGRKRSRGTESTSRGPPRKRGPKSVQYCSQIAAGTNGIKLKIKKFDSSKSIKETKRKRRKAKNKRNEQDEEELMDYLAAEQEFSESLILQREVPEPSEQFTVENTTENGEEQSNWGCKLPELALTKIFQYVVQQDGSIPFLLRASRVCKLWRNVAMNPILWTHMDLSAAYVKQSFRTDLTLNWLCQNRLLATKDLILSWWKINDVSAMIQNVISSCGLNLTEIGLAGWDGLRAEHLEKLAQSCPNLSRIDLSFINVIVSANSKAAVSPTSLCTFLRDIGPRLTHLNLANNTLSCLTQILNAVAENCPELQVLDLSNLRTAAVSSALVPIEKLQFGCTKLRVFRIANSYVSFASSSLADQAASPGFPLLEELSLAVDKKERLPVVCDSTIERILKSSHQLKLLDVRGCMKISESSLVRVPAWDLTHLFLSGCYITRNSGDGLELLAKKWSHSLTEVDLSWSTATEALDAAVYALAEKRNDSPLRILSLLGSSVSFEPVKQVLEQCPHLVSLNLSACRGLPRGIKRLYEYHDLYELRRSVISGKFNEGQSPSESPQQVQSSSTLSS